MKKPYHSVTIRYREREACSAVKQFPATLFLSDKASPFGETQRFLSREAPLLPLTECTVAHCQCHYSTTPTAGDSAVATLTLIGPPWLWGRRNAGRDGVAGKTTGLPLPPSANSPPPTKPSRTVWKPPVFRQAMTHRRVAQPSSPPRSAHLPRIFMLSH